VLLIRTVCIKLSQLPSQPTSSQRQVLSLGNYNLFSERFHEGSKLLDNDVNIAFNQVVESYNHASSVAIPTRSFSTAKRPCPKWSNDKIKHLTKRKYKLHCLVRSAPLNSELRAAYAMDVDIDFINEQMSSTLQILPNEDITSSSKSNTYLIARKICLTKNIFGKYINSDPKSELHGSLILPKRTVICPNCKVLMWIEEKSASTFKSPLFGISCSKGVVVVAVSSIDFDILNELQIIFEQDNLYVKVYKQFRKRINADPSLDLTINLKKNVNKNKQYNLPTTQEVAALISNEENKVISNDLVVHSKNGSIQDGK
ncbi:hypothetical protein BpHYR1_051125, partial [Brachionus plicatilis]